MGGIAVVTGGVPASEEAGSITGQQIGVDGGMVQ